MQREAGRRPGVDGIPMPGAIDPVAPGMAPAAPPVASTVLGGHLEQAQAYADLLADTGVTHGLIGPREIPRLWERHILNCALVGEAFPPAAQVIDVGSGAGLPGLVLAILRPDLELILVEPMLRRTTWLGEAVRALGLVNVQVHRGRAEQLQGELSARWVTARAVARIDKLAAWTAPLLEPGGTLVAMKGSSAADELEQGRPALSRLGFADGIVVERGAGLLPEPTFTIELTRAAAPGTSRGTSSVGLGRRRSGAKGSRTRPAR